MNENERADLVNYRINRAKETIKDVNILLANELWNFAVNRLYYACYYAATAVLVQHNLSAETHKGVRRMLGLHFVQKGLITKSSARFYSEIFEKRHSGDYDDFVEIDKDYALSIVKPAETFIAEIDNIIKNKNIHRK